MRFYRLLLRLYPAAFRAEYGDDMQALFAEGRRAAAGRRAGLLALWIEAVADVLRNAVPAHWDILRQDLRYAARALASAPGFALTVVLVSGLGIGANTAVFTVLDAALLRPLPFDRADRLVKLWERLPGYGRLEASPANYRDWRNATTAFESIGAYRGLSVNMVGRGEPRQLDGAALTADVLPMLGVRPAIGRAFTPAEDQEGAAGTVLLSDGLWRTAFAADPAVLGTRVLLDGAPHVIIGVMPREFRFPGRDAALWTPMRFASADFEDRDDNFLHVIAKLEAGVTLARARDEMAVVARRLEREYPAANTNTGIAVTALRDGVSRQSRLLLFALAGAAACILLIACTNVANLLLARGLARRHELAVRSSLGAGRERLARQLLTESVLLAAIGGAAGLAAAALVLPALEQMVAMALPIAGEVSIDARMLSLAIGLTALTALGFGVVPSLRACSGTALTGLAESTRGGVGGSRERLRGALVVVEVAASIVLLIAAGLLIRALVRVQATDPGFRPDQVLTLRTSLTMPKYEATARRAAFYERVLSEIRRLPRVTGAAYTSFLPIAMGGGIWAVQVGERPQDRTQGHTASLRQVTPGYFATLGIPLRLGRDVSEEDTLERPFAAVVSESFARRYWPGENPLGRRFRIAFQERTVIGVAGDVRVRGLERTSEPQVYLPHRQVPDGGLVWYAPKDLVVRSAGDPAALLPDIRRIVREVDPEQPVSDVQLLSDIVASDTAPRRSQLRVLGVFAATALLLAGVGIHGLLAFTVSHRTPEIAVRMALGARTGDVVSMVVRDAVRMALTGVAIGGALGYAAAKGIQGLLAGVPAGDGWTFGAAAVLALAMALAGSVLPALRAARVDPTMVMRAGS